MSSSNEDRQRNRKIAANEAMPAVKDAFVRDYVRAAFDDEANPVAAGEVSRLDAVKARFAGQEPHKLTKELVKEAPEGAKELVNSQKAEGQLSEDRRAKLMGHTSLGRATVAAKK